MLTFLSRYLDVDSIAGIAFANLLAILLVILLCFLAGLVARSGFMRRLAARFERNVLQGIPIYQLVKTTAESVAHAAAERSAAAKRS